jgi:hypothetical protein
LQPQRRERYVLLPTVSGARPAARPAERHYRSTSDWLDLILDKAGQLNLAPYSFFNCFNYRPPIIGFSSNGWKDSVRNITETGEFVWNLATRDLAEAMNETSATLPHGEDEFTAGLTPVASQLVSSPRGGKPGEFRVSIVTVHSAYRRGWDAD